MSPTALRDVAFRTYHPEPIKEAGQLNQTELMVAVHEIDPSIPELSAFCWEINEALINRSKAPDEQKMSTTAAATILLQRLAKIDRIAATAIVASPVEYLIPTLQLFFPEEGEVQLILYEMKKIVSAARGRHELLFPITTDLLT